MLWHSIRKVCRLRGLVPSGALLSAWLLATPPACALSYQPVDLGDLGGGFGRARAVNDSGAIVGESLLPIVGSIENAFLWEMGSLTNLGTLGGAKSRALDINASGVVAGWAQDGLGRTLPTAWDITGAPGALPTLGINGGAAQAVNLLGTLAGYSFLTPSTYHAALWDTSGVTDLGTLGGNLSIAYDINVGGLVVGAADNGSGQQRAALWSSGAVMDLGLLPGGAWNTARGINDFGQVILWGVPDGEARNRATFWSGGLSDAPIDLGTFGGDESWAYGLNNSGHVVGWAEFDAGNHHAFVWDGASLLDLGTLGGLFSAAYGISDNGIVVGYAQDAAGRTRATAWFPIPEPAMAAVALLFLAGAMLWPRRADSQIPGAPGKG